MTPLWLHIRAPFAAFRWLQAGVYRASSPTMPPSAAWGLVLNLAGIETRDTTASTVTLRRKDVPRFQVAIGERCEAQVNSLYQQLHGYPVGGSGKDLAALAHGSKYCIVPVRREVLTGLDLMIGIRANDEGLVDKIRSGLHGSGVRYGLPFLGDNSFLIDRIDVLAQPLESNWYCRLGDGAPDGACNTCRLTVDIDRMDSAKTSAELYRRAENQTDLPPESAWTWVPRAPD